MKLTQREIQSTLRYDPEVGHFFYTSKRGRMRAGSIAGTLSRGYVRVRIGGSIYMAHVIAWLYMTGEWPQGEIDHIDGNPANNSWTNLRQVTHKQNLENMRRLDRGVNWDAQRSRWVAQIKHNYQRVFLGRFQNKEDAVSARREAETLYFTHAKQP